jgi:hypothetical protein
VSCQIIEGLPFHEPGCSHVPWDDFPDYMERRRRQPNAWQETAASPKALTTGRRREQHALQNENTGERWDRADCITLRCVAAIHQRIIGGPHPDALSSA